MKSERRLTHRQSVLLELLDSSRFTTELAESTYLPVSTVISELQDIEPEFVVSRWDKGYEWARTAAGDAALAVHKRTEEANDAK